MPQSQPRAATSDKIAALLEEWLVDACGDDEQLSAVCEGAADALPLPLDVHVIGEPVTLVAWDRRTPGRLGLFARCRRTDGCEHRVSLADVQMSPDSPSYPMLAAYCRWFEIEPAPLSQGSPSEGERPVRTHKVEEVDIDLTQPVELVVLTVKERAVRCRLLGTGREITLRASSTLEVPGQILTVDAKKHWRHNGHPYLSGTVRSAHIEAAALKLPPLGLTQCGVWDPTEEWDLDSPDPIEDWAEPILARGQRTEFEMETVIPGRDPDEFDTDPILDAIETWDSGSQDEARDMVARLLESDLRCLDAHALLGSRSFLHRPRGAANHYEVAVDIGDLALGDGFCAVSADWAFACGAWSLGRKRSACSSVCCGSTPRTIKGPASRAPMCADAFRGPKTIRDRPRAPSFRMSRRPLLPVHRDVSPFQGFPDLRRPRALPWGISLSLVTAGEESDWRRRLEENGDWKVPAPSCRRGTFLSRFS